VKEWLETEVPNVLLPAQTIAYGILGIFILILGAYMFTTSVDAKEDLKENNENMKIQGSKKTENKSNSDTKICNQAATCKSNSCEIKTAKRSLSIREKFQDLESKPVKFFLIWGSLLSFACLGEVIILEATIIWTSISVISNSLGEALLFGGSAMLILAIGASIPLITVATLSGTVRNFFNNVEKLESLRTIGGIILILMGLIYSISLIFYFVGLF
jgi:hypothetical protein